LPVTVQLGLLTHRPVIGEGTPRWQVCWLDGSSTQRPASESQAQPRKHSSSELQLSGLTQAFFSHVAADGQSSSV